MHREVLSQAQIKLLPLIEAFAPQFGLVGGTAIALQIGHRRSIDFDLFATRAFKRSQIRRTVVQQGFKIETVLQDEVDQFTFVVNGVQLTFLTYPFAITYPKKLTKKIKMPDLATLAAMKAYALGRRAKWKDYVDLYFIFSKVRSIKKVAQRATKIFSGEFNEKIFRTQLAYFADINYAEKIDYLPGFKVSDATIKKELVKLSLA